MLKIKLKVINYLHSLNSGDRACFQSLHDHMFDETFEINHVVALINLIILLLDQITP